MKNYIRFLGKFKLFSCILLIIISLSLNCYSKDEISQIRLSEYVKLLSNQDDLKFIKEFISPKELDSLVINRVNKKKKRIGTWLVNDDFGNLKYIEKYAEETNEYAKSGQFLYRDEKINIYNKSQLKIKLLFDQFYEKFGKVKFEEGLFFFKICYDTNLVICFKPKVNFLLKLDTVENIVDYKCRKELKSVALKSTNPDYNSKSGKIIKKKQNLITSFGKVTVTSYGSFCEDTGYNLVELYSEEGKLTFSGMRNVSIFEADADNNGKNELYVLTHQDCAQMLRIYRISI